MDDYANKIKTCHIFNSLELNVCENISYLFEIIQLNPHDILFKQGDTPDNLYILIEGGLSAVILSANKDKIIGNIEAGESIGELGALSGEPRALTIIATRQSSLLKISSKEFVKLCHQYPSIMIETIKPIITRSQKNIKLISSEKECTYAVILIDNSSPYAEKIKHNLLNNVPKNPDFEFIIESKINSNKPEEFLHEREKKYSKIIVLLDVENSKLKNLLLQKSETIYIFEDGDKNNEADVFSKSIINTYQHKTKCKFELVIYHNTEKTFPSNTSKWLENGIFSQHHHLRLNKETDYQRLLRFFSGNAIGLVLGGGGTLGWTHLGVIKALLENNIPIDAIGGTSIGSFVGGIYLAFQEQYDELEKNFAFLFKKVGLPSSLTEFTIPIISIISANKWTHTLQSFFQNYHIEDLWKPYFCITSNMSDYAENSHHAGLLWRCVSASCCIPGIFPPVVINKQLHYDGGICNNLPSDIMKNIVGVSGKIISVSLNSFHDHQAYDYPPILKISDILKLKLNFKKERSHFPPFFNTFYSVITFGTFSKEKEHKSLSDVLISPDLSKYNMLHATKKQANELFNLGYNEMQNKLKNIHFSKETGQLK